MWNKHSDGQRVHQSKYPQVDRCAKCPFAFGGGVTRAPVILTCSSKPLFRLSSRPVMWGSQPRMLHRAQQQSPAQQNHLPQSRVFQTLFGTSCSDRWNERKTAFLSRQCRLQTAGKKKTAVGLKIQGHLISANSMKATRRHLVITVLRANNRFLRNARRTKTESFQRVILAHRGFFSWLLYPKVCTKVKQNNAKAMTHLTGLWGDNSIV